MSNRVLQIYKSRKYLLELLEQQKYNVTDYENFSINEVDAMYSNSQLDMILHRDEDDSFVYVNYVKKWSADTLERLVEDLFEIETVLKDKTKDHIILVMDNEPNQTVLEKVKYIFDREGYFIIPYNIARLQFNILKHELVPPATVLKEQEKEALFKKYNLTHLKNLPEISRFDPQAMAIGIRPGQIVKLERKSPTAMVSLYYRVCI
jgi:DNA-directed RNA polymerase subunit H (RpoH/RPB5)/DNA-directed RNA polymerase subunit F